MKNKETIIIEYHNINDIEWYIAYSEKLGKYACYGQGNTEIKALKSFIKEREVFLKYLKDKENEQTSNNKNNFKR